MIRSNTNYEDIVIEAVAIQINDGYHITRPGTTAKAYFAKRMRPEDADVAGCAVAQTTPP